MSGRVCAAAASVAALSSSCAPPVLSDGGRAGIQAKDLVLEINGEETKWLTLYQAAEKLQVPEELTPPAVSHPGYGLGFRFRVITCPSGGRFFCRAKKAATCS